jgi:hypothetical protein
MDSKVGAYRAHLSPTWCLHRHLLIHSFHLGDSLFEMVHGNNRYSKSPLGLTRGLSDLVSTIMKEERLANELGINVELALCLQPDVDTTQDDDDDNDNDSRP